MIVKENPPKRGKKLKYNFPSLQPGECLKIPAETMDQYRSIMQSLKQWKDRNQPSWETTTRFNDGVVSVYRLS